jgi:hypothetical protein
MRENLNSRGFFSLLAFCIGERVARIPGSLHSNLSASASRAAVRIGEAARSFVTPGRELDIDLAGSATLNAQFWLNRFPWRPTAGWAVVAAILSLGALWQPVSIDWPAMALLLLLADPLWGGIWRLAGGRTELLPLRDRDLDQGVWLPYMESGSPADLLLGRHEQGVLHLVFRVALPTVLVTFAIAFVLGPAAIWMTVALLAVSMLGWLIRHTVHVVPAILHSVVTIVLPWFLALTLLGANAEHERWGVLAGLVALWFLHNWGEIRVLRASPDTLGIALLAVADAGIALMLVSARAPVWLAVLVVLWLPTWLSILRRRPMLRLNFWWLLAMLVSAAAVGQSVSY